jgi:hypothetical protein
MLNIHLNGDMVRCPDIVNIQKRLIEKRQKERRCKYGIHELNCPQWTQYCQDQPEIKPLMYYGRCHLFCCDKCPMRKKRKATGNMQKTFRIDNKIYRQLSSAAHYTIKTSKVKTLFMTLTFPPYKDKHYEKCKNPICSKFFEQKHNQLFSKFIENLRTNYGCSGYVAVRERGEKRFRIHYHLLISIPFISFFDLNDVWCNTIKDICNYSNHALYTDKKKKFIKDPVRAIRYVCKYFSKSKGSVSNTRIVFIANEINVKHRTFDNQNCEYYTVTDLLNHYKSIKVTQTSDYTTAFRIMDKAEFDDFCNNYLYKLFGISEINKNGVDFSPG